MQTNCKYNISKLLPDDSKRTMWIMDTSHYHILSTILNDTNNGILRLEETKDGQFKITHPIVVNGQKDAFAENTVGQYLRILIFYGVIDYKVIVDNGIKTTKEFRKFCLENDIEIKKYHDFTIYLKENLKEIAKGIKEIIKLDNFLSTDALKILSTAEFYLNYKDHADKMSINEIEGYFYNCELKPSLGKSNSKVESIHGEFLLYMKTLDYFDVLFAELDCRQNITSEEKENEVEFDNLDFEGIGYLGELIINQYLKTEYEIVDWVSRRNKRSNHDFKADEDYIEVKTTSASRSATSFNMSWNEFTLQQTNRNNYYIYYVDGIYKLKKPEKEIVENLENIKQFIDKNEISVEKIDSKKLTEKFLLIPKGYWVRENK